MIWNQIIALQSGHWSWSSTLFKLSILTFLFNCEISSAGESSSSSSKSSPYKQSSHHHSPWGSWSTSELSIHPWDEPSTIMPNIVPLTLKEQSIRESKTFRKQSHSSTKRSHNAHKNGSNSSKTSKTDQEKNSSGKSSGSRKYNDDKADAKNYDTKVDLAILRKQALEFGSLVLNFINNEMQSKPGESRGAGARGFLSEIGNTFKLERKEGLENEGGEEHHRGVIDWLARLIGVQGKTLGEFLREYQVHVLYDLVFIFFKWIFFLYAGLLIP